MSEVREEFEVHKLNESGLKKAGELAEVFSECLRSGRYKERVERNYQQFHEAGVFATPTFFVNGKPLVRFGERELAELVRQEVAAAYAK